MIHWDAFAALVALKAIKFIIAFTYKILYPATTQCERIQWVDVPNGQLLQCKNDCQGYWEERQDCLNSTLGNFFQRAWVSASRRDMKPKQLSLDTHYVQTHQKLVRAYLLLNRYSGVWFREDIIQFRDVDGVLTDQLLNVLPPYFHFCTQTKREIERILEGYPPQYTEHVLIPQAELPTTAVLWISIPSPVQQPADIYRGGWVVATVLDWNHNSVNRKYRSARGIWPLIGHTMEPTSYKMPGKGSVKDFAPRQKAVQQVRHVFHEIRKAFLDQEAVVTAALEFIHPFFSSCADNIEL